jgi:transcriptional regulator with XRE-family HTH domain
MERSVPRKKIVQPTDDSFGQRLVALRKAAGLSQHALGVQIDLSQRMIAYYESRDALPPGHVLSALAEVFSVSVDELVGAKSAPARAPRKRNQQLWRRFAQIEKLPLRDRKELFSVIDAYLERHKLAQRAAS